MKTSPVSVEFGTKTSSVVIDTTKTNGWTKDNLKRSYFHMILTEGKYNPLRKFYRVDSGTTTDHTIEVNGVTFAFEYSIDCNSHSKRDAAKEMAAKLAALMI
jgi:hypothetical protein